MGSLLSTSPLPLEKKRIIETTEGANDLIIASSEPLFRDEMKAESATWSEDSICTTIQRFAGLLPDSAEMRK
ncbi:hypothetical protein PHMEG_00015497 [Phytophthora megakarya]|uniref:Uncharacterized protein n=1 Tax=Phytophthora megakarya TaxID=4795 RepID=A0A225W2Q3_9STRA|nr:hypothetical protein PHMEG_00015497 [Phytophthora megakarya]